TYFRVLKRKSMLVFRRCVLRDFKVCMFLQSPWCRYFCGRRIVEIFTIGSRVMMVSAGAYFHLDDYVDNHNFRRIFNKFNRKLCTYFSSCFFRNCICACNPQCS
ncbi:hypothetical protein RI129_007591, partial [Pyrocoelia pectoralis]